MARKRRRRQRPSPLDDLSIPSEPHRAAIDVMLPQLLIAIVKKHGGTLRVPVAEVDDTGHDNLAFRLVADATEPTFEFVVRKKAGQG